MLALVLLAAGLSTISIDGLPSSSPYEVVITLPPGAPVLHAGDDVRIGGERAGQVQSVALAGGSPNRAVATLSLGSNRIGAGATARVRPLGLAGAVYVDLNPGSLSRPLASGAVIDATAGVQLTDVISGFDGATRRALAAVLSGYGSGLAGRGVQVGNVIARAPALLANTTAALHALAGAHGALAAAIGDTTVLAGGLAPAGSTTLTADLESANELLQSTGSRAGSLGAAIAAVPGLEQSAAAVLPSVDRLLSGVEVTTRALTPGTAALAAALPAVNALERSSSQLGPLRSIAAALQPAFTALMPALRRLIGPASGLVPLASPVAELAGVLIPYRTELVQAPLGFTHWGNFTYDFGTGRGHRAVRFSMVLTCATARDPYPRPGQAAHDRKSCR